MDRTISSPTLETIARTIDEFSFIFTGFPPRLPPSVKQRHYRAMNNNHHPTTGLSNVYSSLSPERDYVFQSFERKDRPLPPPPPPSPQHYHLREGRLKESESATPPHIRQDSDRSAISAKPCSSGSSESGVPPSSSTGTEGESKSESEGYPLSPYTDIATTAKLEMLNHHLYAHPPIMKRRYQLPNDYTRLPHFHPPRFSRRLRNLIAERRRPMRLHLAPVMRKLAQDEEKGQVADSYWFITSPDAEAAQVKPRSWRVTNVRFSLLVIFAALFGGIIMLVIAMTLGWAR